MQTEVSLVSCPDYKRANISMAIKKSIGLLGGMANFIKPRQKVLLKINMLGMALPEEGVTTHPEVVRAVIKLVKEAGGIPVVGDSPGFEDALKAAKYSGFQKVCDEENIQFIDLKTETEVKNPDAQRFKTFCVAKEALDADVIINLAKFKTHNLTGITGAVKNMFGCIPGLLKSKYHLKIPDRENFSLMLVDLAAAIKPRLSIMDAVVALEGEGGPNFGPLRNINLIAASENPIALDWILSQVVNIPPLEIPTNYAAKKYSLVPEQIEVVGEKLEKVKNVQFKKIPIIPERSLTGPIGFLAEAAKGLLIEKPQPVLPKCTGCKVCFKVCRSGAIAFPKRYPIVNYNKCIRCFCCAEMCPEGAIRVKRPIFYKLFYKLYTIAVDLFLRLKSRFS
ncbi:DUF362 domain-containing protein [Candidatus Margulisiibacteriota bacterium]